MPLQSVTCVVVQGDWEAGQARDAQNPGLAPMGDDAEGDNSDGDVFGEFEDVELGVKHAGASSDPITQAAMQVTALLANCFAAHLAVCVNVYSEGA